MMRNRREKDGVLAMVTPATTINIINEERDPRDLMDTSMAIKVVKFGGSSLADAKQIQKAAAIIKADPQRRYVVPSAPGKRFSKDIKVTDMLYTCYDLAEQGLDFSDALQAIRERYNDIITGLGMTFSLDDEFEEIAANFKKRAEEGFYDGKPFFALQKGIYAITGASNDEGTEGVTDDGKFIENECSVNLWPFKGALLGYSSQQGYSDSRFFFTGALEITEENKKELRGYTDQETSAQVIPDELITAFEKRGSVPGFAGTYTVFGQVINGFDALDKILWSASDKSTMKPLEEIKIVKVTLDSYKDGKFTIEEPTSDKYLTAKEIAELQNESNGTSDSNSSTASSSDSSSN